MNNKYSLIQKLKLWKRELKICQERHKEEWDFHDLCTINMIQEKIEYLEEEIENEA